MSDTQEIKDKIDVVDLVGEYVQLKPSGINHKGLCPFHNEKSPSFMVNRERQSWHCFGCNKGGDIFSFIEEIEGMEFVEALKLLANRAGVTLTQRGNPKEASQKARLKDICQEAARFYYNFLTKMEVSKPAQAYLAERGLSQETIDAWQIGYVPDQWDLLTKYLLKKGHSIDDLVAAGLTIQKDGATSTRSARSGHASRGFYDRFRGRIMFPIRDVHGTVVGFTARILVESENSGGKYINTPQTLIYDKSRIVFGLDKAKQPIRKSNHIIMVEGQMDVIASHQAGFFNVVATSGTALTEHQIGLLKRYASKMSMAFDADDAGAAAAKRGIELAMAAGMQVGVIQIPEGAGKDPDECIKNNPDVWKEATENAQDVMEWYFSRAFQKHDISNPHTKQALVDELLVEIARIPFAVQKDHWLQELSGRAHVDVSVLREDLKRVGVEKKQPRPHAAPAEPKPAAPTPVQDRYGLLVERMMALLLRYPSLGETNMQEMVSLTIHSGRFAGLYKAMQAQYTDARPHALDIEALRSEGEVDILLMKGELDFSHISKKEAAIEFTSLAAQLTQEWRKQRRTKLQQEIEAAERAGNKARLKQLLEEYTTI